MGIYIELENLDTVFSQLKVPPIIVNDIADSSIGQKNQLNSTIFTTYTNDLLSNIPACECGGITGEYNLGIKCNNCETVVKHPHGNLDSFVWLRAPIGVRALINPTVWIMLTKYFNKGNFNLIKWLVDATYRSDAKIPEYMPYIEGLGFQRGLNYFVEHFDEIMKILFDMKAFKRPGSKNNLEEFIKKYRNNIFSQYIPLPNKALMVVEETNTGPYIDPILTGGIDAIRTLVGIDSPLNNYSIRVKENRAIKCIDKLGLFYESYYKDTLAQKEGTFRKHVYGTRSHFSFRAVISSITDPHHYSEIYIPWSVAISVLDLHLTNKLIKKGMNPNEIKSFLYKHAYEYNYEIDQLFKELISESEERGIECVLTRNPSLGRGSCLSLFIARVKTDVRDQTISLSILATKNLNAD